MLQMCHLEAAAQEGVTAIAMDTLTRRGKLSWGPNPAQKLQAAVDFWRKSSLLP